jgi:hypothetical protein
LMGGSQIGCQYRRRRCNPGRDVFGLRSRYL